MRPAPFSLVNLSIKQKITRDSCLFSRFTNKNGNGKSRFRYVCLSSVVVALFIHVRFNTVEELNVAFTDVDGQKMQKERKDQDVIEPEV